MYLNPSLISKSRFFYSLPPHLNELHLRVNTAFQSWNTRTIKSKFRNDHSSQFRIFFNSFRKWKHALFICCSNDYRLSRLLHARTELWMPMDYVVRWLPAFRGKNNRTLLNISLKRNRIICIWIHRIAIRFGEYAFSIRFSLHDRFIISCLWNSTRELKKCATT